MSNQRDKAADKFVKIFDKYRYGIFKTSLDSWIKDGKLSGSFLDSVREFAEQSRITEQSSVVQRDEVLDEREALFQAFDKIKMSFESRHWLMEGRGCYPYNDERYKEEVRYIMDEFNTINNDLWKQIKSKSFEYKEKLRKDIIAEQQSSVVVTDEKIDEQAMSAEEVPYIVNQKIRIVLQSVALHGYDLICAEGDIIKIFKENTHQITLPTNKSSVVVTDEEIEKWAKSITNVSLSEHAKDLIISGRICGAKWMRDKLNIKDK